MNHRAMDIETQFGQLSFQRVGRSCVSGLNYDRGDQG